MLSWVPIPQPPRECCLELLVGQPHSLLSILDSQTWLAQVYQSSVMLSVTDKEWGALSSQDEASRASWETSRL